MISFLDHMKKKAELERARIQRKVEFEVAAGLNPGERWEGTYDQGMKFLEKFFKKKWRTIPGSLEQLHKRFGKVQWQTMIIKPVVTNDIRWSDDGGVVPASLVRSDVTIDGVDKDGKHVQFRYMQGPSHYSGYRMFRYNGGALKLFSALFNLDTSRRYLNQRSRERFTKD